ncbi:MAG: hypothetical protein IKA71_08085 [Lentisphaeria bacterium]|nr:hypothetical protein [Lentisphaeria bacterium]
MSKAITVLAAGGAGCRIIAEFAARNPDAGFRLLALDSDISSLQASGLPEESLIQVGKLWRAGRGCGGMVMDGQMAVANERKVLSSILAGTEVLLVVAGLGGGLATGGLPVIFSVAAKMRITSVLLCTLPFAMEGYQRRSMADRRISEDIMPVADAVVALPNDLLFNKLDAETPILDAFRYSDIQMADSLLALASILGGGNLFSADIAAFTGVLKRRHGLCSLGVGRVENGESAPEKVVEQLLESPFLGGRESFETADAVMFSLLGGAELSLGNARAALDLAVHQVYAQNDKNILLGAATTPALTGKLQLTALTVRYLDRDLEVEPEKSKRKSRHSISGSAHESGGEQLALPNLLTEAKGIMENTLPVVIDGIDLDVPAFKRHGVALDLGK